MYMDLWERFFTSGKICDYIDYRRHQGSDSDADVKMSDPEGKKCGRNKQADQRSDC